MADGFGGGGRPTPWKSFDCIDYDGQSGTVIWKRRHVNWVGKLEKNIWPACTPDLPGISGDGASMSVWEIRRLVKSNELSYLV